MIDRCRRCDRPYADPVAIGHVDGCECPACLSSCWSRFGQACLAVDWRARALEAERRLADNARIPVADRTPDEIDAMREAAAIGCNFDGVNCIAWKGDPAVMICVEPMMTVSLGFVGSPDDRRKVWRVPVIGPVTRMAIALHLGLTPGEAEATGLTPAAAERDLLAHVDAIAAEIVRRVDGASPVNESSWSCPPSDPRWIEGQRAAEPWRAPGKACRRG